MNDPTGIGAAILGAIRVAYWGLAVACLGLALWLPKTRRTKLVLGLSVAGGFLGPPTFFVARQTSEVKAQRDAIQAACSTSQLVNGEISAVPGFYAGSDALVLVHGPRDRGQLKSDPGFADVANYLVERKMSFLELDAPSTGSRLRRELWANVPGIQHPYWRLSVAQAGTPECAASARWSIEYPAQKLPGLRKRGLMPEHCIAVEGVRELRSRYRITARVTPAVVDRETRFGLWERMLEVRDVETASTPATFRLFVGQDKYSNHWIGCGKTDEARLFEQIVPISPDPRLVQLREVTDEEPVSFPVKASATPGDIKHIGKLDGLDSVNSTNIISADGTIWFEHNYKATDSSGSFTHRGYFLTIVVDGELRKTLVRVDGSSMSWITGLQVTESVVRFVARTHFDASSWLVEYSKNGAPIRVLALTQDQVQALKGD